MSMGWKTSFKNFHSNQNDLDIQYNLCKNINDIFIKTGKKKNPKIHMVPQVNPNSQNNLKLEQSRNITLLDFNTRLQWFKKYGTDIKSDI